MLTLGGRRRGLLGEPRGQWVLCWTSVGVFTISRNSRNLVSASRNLISASRNFISALAELDGDGLPGYDGHVANVAAVPAGQGLQDEDDLEIDPGRVEVRRH